MNKKFKIYMIVIAFLTGFFLYALFIMKDDYKVEEKDKLPPTVHIKKVTVGDPNIYEYIPEYLPKPIPEDVLTGAKENDFYYYLFLNPNKKSVVYQFRKGSTLPSYSEKFHTEIDKYLKTVRYDGNYKNKFVTDYGANTYEKNILKTVEAASYIPKDEDSKKYINDMFEKKARIDAVKAFHKECAKTFCIINNKTNEYVILDTRDVAKAKKLLDDYKLW